LTPVAASTTSTMNAPPTRADVSRKNNSPVRLTMNTVCAVCDLRFERAQGYWIGAIYVNYGATTTIAVAGFFMLWGWTTLSTAAQLAIWVPFCVLFPLWFFRYSRAVWLAVEHGVNPEL
jgi:uncharacterized protein (DUF983 family)